MLVTTNFSVTVYLRLGVGVGVCFGHCAIGFLDAGTLISSRDRVLDARTVLEESHTSIAKS